jgi:hypothetical protein
MSDPGSKSVHDGPAEAEKLGAIRAELRSYWWRRVAVLSVALALAGVAAFSVFQFLSGLEPDFDHQEFDQRLRELSTETSAELLSLRREIADVAERLTAATADISENSAVAAELAEAKSHVDSIDDRLGRFEDALGRDPARALEVAVLDDRLTLLETQLAARVEGIQSEARAIGDVFRWVLGTFVLGVVVLLANVLIQLWKLSRDRQADRA